MNIIYAREFIYISLLIDLLIKFVIWAFIRIVKCSFYILIKGLSSSLLAPCLYVDIYLLLCKQSCYNACFWLYSQMSILTKYKTCNLFSLCATILSYMYMMLKKMICNTCTSQVLHSIVQNTCKSLILQNFYIISSGYLAGRMRSAFIHHQDFVSVSCFMLVLPKIWDTCRTLNCTFLFFLLSNFSQLDTFITQVTA